ncbi:hypothetical protein ACEPAF_7786 [Sanghuangporus sanghuang]
MTATGVTASELSRREWVFAFALVTTLFFTWGFAYGLLDVLNAHFQNVFGISKLQSTLLQLAYFGAYFVWAPFAGLFMRKVGYKKGIHLGLSLYSLGAIFFWPSAKFKAYGGFVGCTFIIGCGLATLEVAANSYITVLGSPKYAAARLNFSQGFQGVASFSGPLIASHYFFKGKNATTLDTVQWVYLAVAGLGIALNILFYFSVLPEISEDALSREMASKGLNKDIDPFYKQYRTIFGFVAQLCYVGAQVAVAAFVVNFLSEEPGLNISQSKASTMFSLCQVTFTVGRFVGVVILNWIDPALLFTFHAVMCVIASICVATLEGWTAVGFLYVLFFYESICYPCIFTLGTKNLGIHTKRGSGLIVMGIGGGAWYPSAQGALADRASTRRSYLVPMTGYLAMLLYAGGLVVHQTITGGFRFFNVNEEEAVRTQTDEAVASTADVDAKLVESVYEHYSEFRNLAGELGRRKAKLHLVTRFWTLSSVEKERLARLSENPGSFSILSEALEDIDSLQGAEESQVSEFVDEENVAGIVVRTDYSDDAAWSTFIEKLIQAERELAMPLDEEDFLTEEANADEQDHDGSESDSDEEMASPAQNTEKSSALSRNSLFALLIPPDSSPLRPRLVGASNLAVLRLVNEVDVIRTPRPPARIGQTRLAPSGHRLTDLHGFVEAYSGPLVWIYDARSNIDGAARVVSQCADGVGSATADSWRARVSFLPELQLNLVSGSMKIDFGGLDRWNHDERQKNMAIADNCVF